jgi:Tol biopolymer transport system component
MDTGSRIRSGGSGGARSPFSAIPGGVAPFLAVLGLVIIAIVSVSLLTGTLPTVPGGGGGGPVRTPTPSNVVITDPRVNVPGTLVYAKDGNIWLQSGSKATQLTTSGFDSMPTWSADGKWIYFIRSIDRVGRWPVNGAPRPYDLSVPYLERIHPDRSANTAVVNGAFSRGTFDWSFFIREPSLSPDGKSVAVISDGPDPTTSDLVLKFINLTTGAITNPRLPDIGGLGHQDPAWSPDGKSVLYVRDDRDGTRGSPVIIRYDIGTKRSTVLTGPGYIAPAWSPDGRFIAATKTDAFGTDIVILDARTGAERLRLTNDTNSFDPAWSPAGDSIAFFRVDRGVVDLELVKLTGTAPQWTVGATLALTVAAGLDASSRPAWFIPADQLPKPTPSPTPLFPSGPGATTP